MSDEGTSTKNSKPTIIREAASSTLNNWFKTWLDFKVFLKQRRLLLDDPKVALTGPSEPDTNWKSPFAFATQGLVLTTVLIQLIASAFGLFVVRPESYIKRLRERNTQFAQTLKNNLAATSQTDDQRESRDYVAKTKNLIAQTEEIPKQLDYAEKLDAAAEMFAKILVPLSLVLAAVFFRVLVYRLKEVGAVFDKEQVMQAYLYIVTARLFWMNAALSLIYAIIHYSMIYSGFYDREMFDSVIGGGAGMTQLLFLEAEIALPVFVCLPVVLYSFHKMSVSLRKVFDLPPPNIWYDLIASYVRVANFLSALVLSVVLFICSWGYAKLITVSEKHKIKIGSTVALSSRQQ